MKAKHIATENDMWSSNEVVGMKCGCGATWHATAAVGQLLVIAGFLPAESRLAHN